MKLRDFIFPGVRAFAEQKVAGNPQVGAMGDPSLELSISPLVSGEPWENSRDAWSCGKDPSRARFLGAPFEAACFALAQPTVTVCWAQPIL